jgi:hypothetical protein
MGQTDAPGVPVPAEAGTPVGLEHPVPGSRLMDH